VQALHDLGVLDDAVSEAVLTGPLQTFALDFHELIALSAALRALSGRILPLIDIAANETSEFLFHNGYSLVSCKIAKTLESTKIF
jgi:hypothetical protein